MCTGLKAGSSGMKYWFPLASGLSYFRMHTPLPGPKRKVRRSQ